MCTEPVPINSLKVLMFPWLAYGHISPYLQLAKILTDRGFSVYLCSTPINLGFIKKKITEKYSASIQLVELHLQETPELPAHYHTTNGLPRHLVPTLQKAISRVKPDVSYILKTLKPDLVIYDILQTWTAALTAVHNIPAVKFYVSGAASFAYFCHLFIKPGEEFPFPAIFLSEFEQNRTLSFVQRGQAGAEESDPEDQRPHRFCDSIMLVRGSKELEGKYMDYIYDIFRMKVAPLGTLSEEPVDDQDDNNELIQWLRTKSELSSVFVSFGSEYYLTREEMEELAFGLELSNVNFIWVVRFPVGGKIRPEEALPAGFLERVKDKGRIVEGWAPQAKILGHPSTGGFICHCGWNSLLESVEFGVPIIAMPMHMEQPMNARLVVEMGIAVEIMRDENGKFERYVIAEAIKDVVVKRMGENLRKKMRDVNEKIKLKETEELDEVVGLLKQLCEEKKQT